VTGGLVLAAGAARRFGAPKQLAELDGVPLLQHAVDAMLAARGVDRVVVVLGAGAGEVRAAVDFGDAEVVECEDWAEGMAASLRAGVAALAPSDAVVVTLGDQPRMSPAAITAVVEAAAPGVGAVRAVYDGDPGHPVLLARALHDRVGRLRGDTGARDLLDGVEVRTVEVGHLGRPGDVDTPEELEALRS
jgi:CTP:molybdopterin cytidylyltransferase MocA